MFNIFKKPVPQVLPEDVKRAIETGKNYILLDVRTPEEFKRGKLTGSINLPVDKIGKKVESQIPDKTTLVYVYCLSGSRSLNAVEIMLKLGYTNVFDMAHGLLAWRIKGYPVNS